MFFWGIKSPVLFLKKSSTLTLLNVQVKCQKYNFVFPLLLGLMAAWPPAHFPASSLAHSVGRHHTMAPIVSATIPFLPCQRPCTRLVTHHRLRWEEDEGRKEGRGSCHPPLQPPTFVLLLFKKLKGKREKNKSKFII